MNERGHEGCRVYGVIEEFDVYLPAMCVSGEGQIEALRGSGRENIRIV
jgi:hypothetical protein